MMYLVGSVIGSLVVLYLVGSVTEVIDSVVPGCWCYRGHW